MAELITLDGNRLLSGLQIKQIYGQPVYLDVDLYKNVSQYTETALLYQIRKELGEEFSQDLFRKVLFFVDFWDFFQWKDTGRNVLFESLLKEGFTARWPGSDELVTYVPFEKSQSQAKNCVISFIRKDLFLPVRRRLDLDIGFGDYNTGDVEDGFPLNKGVRQLSKLYAYRGLYLTDAVRLDGLDDLINQDRIVVLEEFPDDLVAAGPVYTAQRKGEKVEKTEKAAKAAKGAQLEGELLTQPTKRQKVDPFDGVGLISPRGAALLNRALDPEAFAAAGIDPKNTDPQELYSRHMAVSFQFRMPFCKGMLHTVDFHRFLRQECELEEDLWVTDAFGIRRNLKNADIIINQTLFKLCGLMHELKEDPQRKQEFIGYYFRKMEQYGHSIYIAQTDRQLRRTGYARLTAQIINTLPFRQEEFDRVVSRHTKRAMEYRLAPVLCSEGKSTVLEDDSSENLHKYIKANYLLALDGYVESLIDSCRKQALNRLFLGKLDVEGDMRFLCRDLMYYLYRLGRRCHCEKNFVYLSPGYIYMPGATPGKPCGLFRSPHLCPNENVVAVVHNGTALHRRYLHHLQRVVFVGGQSQMPDALGGADFDGDMAVVAFQKEVVDACYRKCYREDIVDMPLIRIPSLPPEKSTNATGHLKDGESPYVDIQTIQNTFNSQIGMISNATMKICAAEAIDGDDIPYTGAFCAILNGVEIDAAKSGVRPDLTKVVAFSTNPGDWVSSKAAEAMALVGNYLDVRKDLKGSKLNRITVQLDETDYEIKQGSETIAKFSRDPEGKPYVYQLLCYWAAALQAGTPETQKEEKIQAVCKLRELLQKQVAEDEEALAFSAEKYDYPRDKVLKNLVFRCNKRDASVIPDDIQGIMAAYTDVKKIVNDLRDETTLTKTQSIRQKLLYILQYKYDNIDQTVDNQPTLRQVGNAMCAQLGIKLATAEDVFALLAKHFYCGNKSDEAWLFQSAEDRHTWLAELLDPYAVSIAQDFGAHGYDLTYFAMRELLAEKQAKQLRISVDTSSGDPFRDGMLAAATEAIDRGYSTTRITGQILPRLCREKLEEATGIKDLDILIPLTYDCAKADQRPLVWKMFTWSEIEAYLKKVCCDAQ